ncbi:MAG: hypothetical protein JWO60_2371 [Frankiales bacterium]|nr:hypothetical protein [Frankiales bacterium]
MRKLASLALVGALSLSLAACGNDDDKKDAAGGGSGTPKPAAQIDNLTGEMTEVTLDSAFVAGLMSLKLTPAPVGTAKVSAEGVASFPITGGSATYYKPGTVDPYVQGLINHDGSGLSLTGGGIKVELTNFDVDPGKSMLFGDVSANGTSVVQDAPLFFLDGTKLQPLRMEGTDKAILEGTEVKLTKAAADLLNMTYKTTAVQENALVGVAKITLAVPAS